MIKRKKEKWEKHEDFTANLLQGKIVRGSGRMTCDKGDVKVDSEKGNFLIECKHTKGTGYRISKPLWEKILREARSEDRIPALSIEIDGIKLIACEAEVFNDLLKGDCNE